jgi:hypothetical protein
MNKLYLLLLFISSINGFMIYATKNFKLTRTTEDNTHWNNIFNKMKNNVYYTKCYKWKLYKNRFLLQRNYNKVDTYIYNSNIINISNKIYNINNNTNIFLIDNDVKLYVNKTVKNDINVCIYHPYNQECMLSINIRYNSLSNKLDNIIYKTKSIENNNYYWDNNYKINLKNASNDDEKFKFGKNINLKYPLELKKVLNTDSIYNKQFPYLYENNNNYSEYYYLEMPHNIKLYAPIYNNKHINMKWSFKNEFKNNILDLRYNNNGSLNNINLFMYNK